jgi:hypothetical protein
MILEMSPSSLPDAVTAVNNQTAALLGGGIGPNVNFTKTNKEEQSRIVKICDRCFNFGVLCISVIVSFGYIILQQGWLQEDMRKLIKIFINNINKTEESNVNVTLCNFKNE